jgi:hypothetical protein
VAQGAFSKAFFRKTEVGDADLDVIIRYLMEPAR